MFRKKIVVAVLVVLILVSIAVTINAFRESMKLLESAKERINKNDVVGFLVYTFVSALILLVVSLLLLYIGVLLYLLIASCYVW